MFTSSSSSSKSKIDVGSLLGRRDASFDLFTLWEENRSCWMKIEVVSKQDTSVFKVSDIKHWRLWHDGCSASRSLCRDRSLLRSSLRNPHQPVLAVYSRSTCEKGETTANSWWPYWNPEVWILPPCSNLASHMDDLTPGKIFQSISYHAKIRMAAYFC